MGSKIIKPDVTTYFIVKNGVIAYGIVEPDQHMDSGLSNLQTFTVEQEWLDELALLGIDPYEGM